MVPVAPSVPRLPSNAFSSFFASIPTPALPTSAAPVYGGAESFGAASRPVTFAVGLRPEHFEVREGGAGRGGGGVEGWRGRGGDTTTRRP